MKLVMTLLARDEADIVDAHVSFHLTAGVDLVIAMDHRSEDGTTEILESYARTGALRLFREEARFVRQGMWQTKMARLAATEYGADWVINSDADEFWFARGASLKDALAGVPARYGVARALLRNFIPLRDDSGWFGERMNIRLTAAAPINDPTTPFRPVVKVAHRGHPSVVVPDRGCHRVFGLPWPPLTAWHPLEVLHVPLRSRQQCADKYRRTWTGWEENLRGDLAQARASYDEGRPNPVWDRVALADAQLERGLAEGSLVIDTRLCDALLRENRQPSAHRPGRAELENHALEATVFREAEIVRTRRRLDELAARVARLETRAQAGVRA